MNLIGIVNLVRDAPITHGLPLVIDHFLEGTEQLLPGVALGVCIVDSNGHAPVIATRLPSGAGAPVGRDPSRLFPGFADERVLELEDGAYGSTFHVASENSTLSDVQQQVAVAVQQLLGPMLKHAREFQQHVHQSRVLAQSHAKMVQTEKLASLGQIVAGVVHELNNPLTSIIAYSDYLKKRAVKRGASGEDVKDDLERLGRIGEAAERILKFSRDLVAYARPSTDIPGPVALPEVINQAIVFCEHEFGRNSVRVQKRLEPNLPPVRGIAGQLTQVFVNLFTNAAHAMHDHGGVLEVHAERLDSEAVLVEVADSGVGIPQATLERIFEPFFTTKVEGVGTGLGLSIVRDIVTQHGGELTACARPERGTVFRLHLPTVVVPPSLLPPPP